jgi:putative NADH-flavin reductase
MRVAVFGAMGRTGRLLVSVALARGYEVTASGRRIADPPFDATVREVTGDARDPEHVRSALEGADAVASVMAIREGGPPTTDLSDATETIVGVMRDRGPRRLVVTTNASVFHDRPVDPPFDVVAAEHRRNVAMLRATHDLDWTVLAPMFLTDDDPTGYETAIEARAPGKGLARADLAAAVLDALDRQAWFGRVVGISN